MKWNYGRFIFTVQKLTFFFFIKKAEESKRNTIDSARRLAEDYRPLKHEVDLMRTELLGLEKLPELPNEEKEKMSALGLGILEKPKPMLEGPHGKFEKSFWIFLFSSYILKKAKNLKQSYNFLWSYLVLD